MKSTLKFLLVIIVGLSYNLFSFGAYLSDIPVTIKQPNGQKINIFATGDEFYNWAHDKDGYTIMQNQETGYYCFAILDKDELVASQYVVGEIDPKTTDLKPKVNIKPDKMAAIRNEILKETPKKEIKPNNVELKSLRVTQTINNLVVYIRFADQPEFPAEQATYTSMFNNLSSGANSMRNYFKEATYDQLDISSTFYPTNNGTNIISYQDNHIRDYYVPYSVTNDSGYISSQRTEREHTLLLKAINFVESQVPTSLNIDSDSDGYIDNICFIVQGVATPGYNSILWPHKWTLSTVTENINNKRAWSFNVQLENRLYYNGVGVLSHEMNHTLGAPDLYHYDDYKEPVGIWDIMGSLSDPPPSILEHI